MYQRNGLTSSRHSGRRQLVGGRAAAHHSIAMIYRAILSTLMMVAVDEEILGYVGSNC
ncbi:hypothetical protein LINGRAHAP2_LOCUS15191 [Linum grandiflorum]